MSREDKLEELLNRPKEKFNSLHQNDSLCLSLSTIVRDSWSIRKISKEFSTSLRMVPKPKIKKMKGLWEPRLRYKKTIYIISKREF